jgi:hypothetical protein
MDHVDAQLRHLQPRQWAWWHEGDELRGDDVGIWGFKCPVQAAALRAGQRAAASIGASRPKSSAIGRQHRRETSGSFTGRST